MEKGEHWFHIPKQVEAVKRWEEDTIKRFYPNMNNMI